MKRHLGLVFGSFLLASVSAAQTIPELFTKAKEQIKSSSWADATKTLDALQTEAAKPGNEAVQKQLEAPLAFYRGVCDANLGKTDEAVGEFGNFLKLQPNATIDGAVYSKKAVAAFEKAQKASADRAPSLADAYKEFRGAIEPVVVDAYWGDGAVRWIMTPAEKQTWSSLTDPNARVAFVEKFWEARQALPPVDGHSYREEFDRRVAFADAMLAQDAEQRGSVTDRGMVFILVGPPNWAARKPLRTGDDHSLSDGMSQVGSQDEKNAMRNLKAQPGQLTSGKQAAASAQFGGPGKTTFDSTLNTQETWHYRKELLPAGVPYQELDFKFLTKKGYGVNVLQRETDILTALEAAKPKAGG